MDRLLQCVHQRVTRKPEVQKLDLHDFVLDFVLESLSGQEFRDPQDQNVVLLIGASASQ